MAEVRTRADLAHSVIPSTVSLNTPEMAMFLPDELVSQGLPVDAITCCLTRAQGVANCLWNSLNARDLDDEAATTWALIGLIGQLDRLFTFAADAEFHRTDGAPGTSTEGSNHA